MSSAEIQTAVLYLIILFSVRNVTDIRTDESIFRGYTIYDCHWKYTNGYDEVKTIKDIFSAVYGHISIYNLCSDRQHSKVLYFNTG